MKNLNDIIKQATDIHVHIGPEAIPRKYTAESLAEEEQGKIGGAVLKNHFYSTVPFIKQVKYTKGLKLIGSIVLNNSIGGINPEAVYSQTLLADDPFFVWFPTINAKNFLQKSEFEIAPEWINKKGLQTRESKTVKPVEIFENNNSTKNVIKVLKLIKKFNLILATGHISWQESVALVNKALEIGIKKIVITHPIYQKINMPIKIQKQLAREGCFIEQCYSMSSIDKIPMSKIASQIKEVGTKSVILSSDVGQTFSPPPSQALFKFATLLRKCGIKNEDLYTMTVSNPNKLLRQNLIRCKHDQTN